MPEASKPPTQSILIGIVAISVLVLLAGCASISATSNVGADGTLKKYEVSASMNPDAYSQLNDRAKREGYESFCAQLKDRYNSSNYNEISCKKSSSNGKVTIDIKLKGYNTTDNPRISVSRSGENITYSDSLNTEYDIGQAELKYTVTMPGKIYDTNADELSNNNRTATWNVSENERPPNQVYAESTINPGLLGSLPTINLQDVSVIISTLFVVGYVYYFRSERFENPEINRG